jgi:hypothetical protein
VKTLIRIIGWMVVLLPFEILLGVTIWLNPKMGFFFLVATVFIAGCAAVGDKILDLAE